MKTVTLKERYVRRKLEVLVEALNQDDLQKANMIIAKLDKMKGKGLTNLDSAIERAKADLHKQMGGGNKLSDIPQKILNLVGFDNPLVKAMTFVNALETGFAQIQQFLQKNIGKDIDKNKSLAQLGLDGEKAKTLVQVMQKALTPSGLYSFTDSTPYMDKKALASDLFNTPLNKLENVIQITEQGPQTAELAQDMQGALKAGSVETASTKQGTPTKQSKKTQQTTSTTGGVASNPTTPTGQPTSGDTANKVKTAVDRLKKDRAPMIKKIIEDTQDPEKAALKILSYLVKRGEIKVQ